MAFIQKPLTREGIIIFGDGDESSLISVGNSTYEGYLYFKMRPTPQMRWKKQIPEGDFHPDDRTLNKIYKKDLCIQLSFDPDFPMWLILCDYYAHEDTPLMDSLVHCTQSIKKNRDLIKENKYLYATINSIRRQMRRKAEHPTEDEREKFNFLQNVNDRNRQPIIYPQAPPDFGGEQ